MRLRAVALLLLLLGCSLQLPQDTPAPGAPLTVIHVTDIHFDPTYNPCSQVSDFCRGASVLQQCQYGCDSPQTLVDSMIADMRASAPNPAFIIISGDSAGHDLTESDTLASVRYVMQSLQTAFPGVPLYPVVGNNDVYPKNSLPIGSSSYLTTLTAMLSSGSVLPPSLWSDFSKNGGYYSHSPLPGTLVIGLNTLYYYKKWVSFADAAALKRAQPMLDLLDGDSKVGYYVEEDLLAMGVNSSTLTSDPAGQFAWLGGILGAAQAANQMCIIVWHVGLGTSATGSDLLWQPDFFDSFLEIYAGNVLVMLSGHTHRDFFTLLYDTGSVTNGKLIGYQMIPASITPRDLSNPAYRILSLAANGSALVDYTQRVWLPAEQTWAELYTFTDASGGTSPTLTGMGSQFQRIANGTWPRDTQYTVCAYANTVWSGSSQCIWSSSDQTQPCQSMLCSFTETDSKKLANCQENKPSSPTCPATNSCNIANDYCITI